MEKRNKIIIIILLQVSVIIYSLSSVMGKFASKYTFLSAQYIMYYLVDILLLGLYAIIWQQVIKKIDISIAYANKATNIFWALVFAVLFFKEKILITNIIGAIVIFTGIILVNKND